jgi:2-(1,2-epoxy-1,2-dihydrophenyl)acetyl-CoA isomerase
MDLTSIVYEKKDRIAYVTLNRPDVFNAFDDAQSYELQDVLKDVKKDENIRVMVLTGAGRAFSSGQDLKAIAGAEKRSLSESLYKRYNPIIRAMRELPKPIICRLNGVAAGAGASLALACDFIIASEAASFVEAFVGVGLVLDSGSSWFLPRTVGTARAFEMATMGTKIPAATAFEWGMVNRLVAPEALDEETAKVSEFYANAPTLAIGLMKKMLNRSTHSDLDSMLEYEAHCQEIAGRSADYNEGVAAFNAKRKPDFQGK